MAAVGAAGASSEGAAVEILTNKPEVETKDQKMVRFDLEAKFFALTAPKIYGLQECINWCANNKGKRLLQLVSISDRA